MNPISRSRRNFLVALGMGGALGQLNGGALGQPNSGAVTNAKQAGSLWFPFSSLDSPGDYYPTDGVGGHGTGSLFTESDLRQTSRCYLDSILCTLNSNGGTITIKDANGKVIRSFDVTTPMPQPLEIRFGIPIAVLGGFTCAATSSIAIAGIAFYTKVM
jgi:hypothetical protein